MAEQEQDRKRSNVRALLRNFLIELVVYGVLITLYFLLVLRFLEDFLTDYFYSNLTTYAFLGLLLIVLQGVLLDAVTSFLLNQIKLDRFDQR